MTRSLADLRWPRRTARLTIRPPLPADLDEVFAYRSDPEVARWLSAMPDSVETLAERFLGGAGALVVERDGQLVGDLMVAVQDAWSQAEVAELAKDTQAELGWCIAPAHQEQGYAVEAVRELVAIAFDLGVRRVEAGCFAENLASRRVMAKVGLRQEGYFVAESLHRDGTWRDGVSFALLAQEWASS